MKHVFSLRLGVVLLVLAIASSTGAPAVKASTTGAQGLWRNADTVIRITVTKSEARGQFVEVGQGAQALGFKPGETSFAATINGNYLHGEQTIRYAGACHPAGRKVPMIGRITPDGKVLAIHFYNIILDANCRDTGQYDVTETLWQRAPAND